MKLADFKELNDNAGIYLIKNIINGKCYIGQSIRLKKRLHDHLKVFNSRNNPNRDRMVLYKAFDKYGIDNFEIEILYETESKEYNSIKRDLDNLEKKYIIEYNSQVPNGYNQTSGGDAGVLGLKMTEEQRNTISKNSHEVNSDGRFLIYCYDVRDKYYYTSVSLASLSIILGIRLNTSDLRNNLIRNRYLISRDKGDLESKIRNFKQPSNRIVGKFTSKLTEEQKENIKSGMKQTEFCEKYMVCKKTYYNYKKQILEEKP